MIMPSRRALVRTLMPVSEPLTLAEAKLYLRVDGNEEDSLIADLISAARDAAEKYLRNSLVEQQWKLSFDDYAPQTVTLAYGPVVSVESVTLIDRDGNAQIYSSSLYSLNAGKDALRFNTVLYGHRIEILYNTGYGNPADIPAPIRYGMLAHIAAMYEQRGEATLVAIPKHSVALYAPFREVCL